MFGQYGPAFIWLGIAVIFGIIEIATVQLTTVWFALGAVVCMLLSFLGVKNIILQLFVFAVVSVVTLVATRPFVKKLTQSRKQPTNADANIGKQAVVTQTIDNVAGTGAAKLSGLDWSAKSADGTVIPQGTLVTVRAIEGVKLVVSPEEQ